MTPDFISNTQKAIITKLTGTANDFKTAVNGRVFHEYAPAGTSFPFCTFTVMPVVPDRDSVNKYETLTVRFGLYDRAANRQNVYTLINKLINQLDDSALAITGCQFITIDRKPIIPAPTDDTVYGKIVPYEIQLQY